MTVPNPGDLFWHKSERYRVTAWLCPRERGRPLGPDKVPLRFCTQEEAVYVSGYGVCGCIARVADVTVFGIVGWPVPQLVEARRYAERLAGEPVW